MPTYIDLHTHSTASDGTDTPTQLVEKAHALGLSAIALTDHDNVNGLPEAKQKADELGLEFIQGIELSADYIKGEIHILGYWWDKNPMEDQEFMKSIAMLQEIRTQRNLKLIHKLQEVGCYITEEDVLAEMKGERLMCRPHFAKAMLKKGYVPDMQTAFDKYLAEDGLAYIPKETIKPELAIEILIKAGAFVSIAHPHLIRCKTEEERKSLIKSLKDAGARGLEVLYSTDTEEQQRLSLAYAKEFSLHCTGGSDYHGTVKPHIALGRGTGELKIPYTFLEQIKNIAL